jgi:hypothetical protein
MHLVISWSSNSVWVNTITTVLRCLVRSIENYCRSQWPHSLRHELSSPAQTLGSWVRIPLKAWMSVCVYSVCAVLRVGSGTVKGWSPIQGILLTM